MTTDILIPLGYGSRQDNLELRYCLRSIEKYLKNVGNIFIVGVKPEWLTNVIHIPAKDNPNNWQRAHNIYKKIMAGINYEVVHSVPFGEFRDPDEMLSDNFLFMNDDHYLLTDFDAGEFPYYHRGAIRLNNFSDNIPQRNQYMNTVKELVCSIKMFTTLDFGVHCPILYNKHAFKAAFAPITHWPEYGYEIKSIYGNKFADSSKMIECEDLKFKEPLMKETIYKVLESREWFSIGDKCLKSGDTKTVLQELYPDKSKFEI